MDAVDMTCGGGEGNSSSTGGLGTWYACSADLNAARDAREGRRWIGAGVAVPEGGREGRMVCDER
jgi:hypothetical protein